MDNAFVFARREHHVHGSQLQLQDSSSTVDSVQGSAAGNKDVSRVGGMVTRVHRHQGTPVLISIA